MPGGTLSVLGNAPVLQAVYLPAAAFPTLATNASSTSTLAVPGVLVGDILHFNLQSPPAHIFVENAYVSAPGVITVTWGTDVTGITGATVAALFTVTRPANSSLGLAALPNGVY